jgi:hypothetical protein
VDVLLEAEEPSPDVKELVNWVPLGVQLVVPAGGVVNFRVGVVIMGKVGIVNCCRARPVGMAVGSISGVSSK